MFLMWLIILIRFIRVIWERWGKELYFMEGRLIFRFWFDSSIISLI